MTRYNFISYISLTNDGNTLYGHTTYCTEKEEMLKEIEKKKKINKYDKFIMVYMGI